MQKVGIFMSNDKTPISDSSKTTPKNLSSTGDYQIKTNYTSWSGYEDNKSLPTFRASKGDSTMPNTGLAFGWNHLRPFGNISLDDVTFTKEGAVAGIKMGWVSWSDWKTKIPCFVNENASSRGGIAFPADGNTIIFGRGKRWDVASKG
ncbi:hypothetical protein [Lactiplantibacillus plantarum]|uniref:hypothetical protein n=1 Tax=Lactiplantibacillus plantarum TaxID=1590 RepID=UPI001C9E634A|nr:hypothetical protein [Lactiplantibacillus plantarum]